ncbi:hypothetical protein GCM10010145_54700 [Streptomyces ruber]|uniref:Cytochrome C oxidase subunit I n=2 Tax=Streptomyces TaxID=1883 RepID=A0A918EWG8_9ACTN|nr:hypothetical protein [Streptomyces ruber]GGQ77951.1 hypothetical protein GCM10010145_54700 [Streptomyces ruber]
MTGDRPGVPPHGDRRDPSPDAPSGDRRRTGPPPGRYGAPPAATPVTVRDLYGPSSAEQAAVLVNEVEGHLLARAERDRARREAEALCARLPWLTGAQAEDVRRHYTEQRLDLTRELLRATVARAEELRGEYEARYATLRRGLLKRHAACASAVLVCAVTAVTALSVLRR